MIDIARLGLEIDRERNVRRASDDLGRFTQSGARAERATDRLNRSWGGASRSAARMAGAVLGIVASVVSFSAAVSTIANFDRAMGQVAAVTRATDAEFTLLRATARELGATTEFSAAQAAGGLRFLGQAGFEASEAVAAIGPTLDLATASGLGLAQAADIASNVLSGFSMEASSAGRVADVLAAASSRSNTSVGQLGQAMSTVAPISASLGISLETTAAAIGTLSDAGVQGERAGTALRGVLASLAGPSTQARDAISSLGLTVAEVDPATNDLAVVMGRLAASGMTTSAAISIFGREAATAGLILSQNAGRVDAFGQALANVEGAASEAAGTIRDDLRGDLDGLGSALSGLAIALGDAGLTNALRSVVQSLTDFVRGTALVVSQVGDAIGAIRSLFSEQVRVERAIDNARIALGDEGRALLALEGPMAAGASMSVSMAQHKIREAMARRSNIESIFAEQRALAMQTSEYQSLTQEIGYLRLQSDNLRNRGVDGGAFAPAANRADIEWQLARIQELSAARQALLDPTGEALTTLEQNELVISRLTEALANATDGTVTFGGQTLTTVEATERLNTELQEQSGALSETQKQLSKSEQAAADFAEEMRGNMSRSVDRVSDAFSDWMKRGFRDFRSFTQAVLDQFRSMLSDMVMLSLRNRIVMPAVGFAGGGATGAVAQVVGGKGGGLGNLASGQGLLGGFLGSFGNTGSILGFGGLGGGTGLLGGLGNALSGGLGNVFNIGANSAGLGLAGSIGAAIPVLGAVAAAFSFFRKRTKELDAGLSVTIDNMDTFVQEFRVVQTKRFWGLSKKVHTHLTDADEETTTAITGMVDTLRDGVYSAADALGFASSTFDGFAHTMRISTRGLSEEDAQSAVTKALTGAADAMADMIPGLTGFARVGETASETLERLANSLTTTNHWMGNLQLKLYDISLAGGAAASAFVDLFGTLDEFTTATGSYYQNFFSDAERTARATQLLNAELSALGIDTLPASRAAFRALVDEADQLGDSELVASLIKLSPAFAQITQEVNALNDAMTGQGLYRTLADATYAATAGGYRQSMEQVVAANNAEMADLLREVVRAVREGDLNNARINSKILAIQQRADLEPTT